MYTRLDEDTLIMAKGVTLVAKWCADVNVLCWQNIRGQKTCMITLASLFLHCLDAFCICTRNGDYTVHCHSSVIQIFMLSVNRFIRSEIPYNN